MFKKITPKKTLILLSFFSAVALLGAYISQYFFNMQPCQLCLWQRKPFFAVIILAAIFLTIPFLRNYQKFAIKISVLLFLINAGIAFYHAGVEEKYFKGLDSCSGILSSPSSLNELIIFLEKAPTLRCDKPQFVLFGISMAGWNFIYCLSLAFGMMLILRSKKFPSPSNNKRKIK